ncbi:MAG TPA: hypothetical protein VF062_26560 [Candidatus Limnocylindrales bacterium]
MIYKHDAGWAKGESPTGIIVVHRVYAPDWSSMEYHAMHWNHDQQAWVYSPAICADWLSDEDNDERRLDMPRAEAERLTLTITGGEELPDEDTILWIFQWKGEPPQAEDTPHTWASGFLDG